MTNTPKPEALAEQAREWASVVREADKQWSEPLATLLEKAAFTMDALIAGDADLYDAQRRGEYVPPMQAASARIKGDKDRATQSSAPTEPEYDHTQDGTANFERALSYARSLEADADFSNSQYAFFMAERGDQLRTLTELAHQYLSDLRYPPSPDSKERRVARIEQVLKEVEL